MSYQIILHKRAKKFLDRLPDGEKRRIVEAISKLPTVGDIKPLTNGGGVYRLRVGGYRVIYTVEHDKLIVYIVEIGNRGDVYK